MQDHVVGGRIPYPHGRADARTATTAGMPIGGDAAESARLGEQGPRRRNRDVAGPNHGTGGASLRPGPFIAHGNKPVGSLGNQCQPVASCGGDGGRMLARGLPGLAHRLAQGAWPARVERVPHRGDDRLGLRVTRKHACPSEHLRDIQHCAAGTEPGAEEGYRGQAAGHRQKAQMRCRAPQANPKMNSPG